MMTASRVSTGDNSITGMRPEATANCDPRGSSKSITEWPGPITIQVLKPTLSAAYISQLCASAVEQLQAYCGFGRGWDGYNGEPFEPELIALAIKVASNAAGILEA